MDFQTVAAIIFLVVLTIFVFMKRKNLDTKQIIPNFLYFSMYKTKMGINLMDSAAKRFRRFVRYLGYFGIAVGFLGMIFIGYSLIQNIFVLFTKPEAAPGVGLVLPIKAKGIFYVPFCYWIISIFVIAIVHEFAHGLIARANNLKVKSSGFAFVGTGFRLTGLIIILFSIYFKLKHNKLFDFHTANFLNFSSPDNWLVVGLLLVLISYVKNLSKLSHIPIIPAAFVEPDEKGLRKRPHKEQLSVFAAGPLANILTAFLFLIILYFVMAPVVNAVIEYNGVKFSDYAKGNITYPAEKAGIKIGEIIKEIDNKPTPNLENMTIILKSKKPGEIVTIKTDKSAYEIKLEKNPENESAAFIGISQPEQSTTIKGNIKKSFGEFLPNALVWIYGMVFFIYVLNFGIGLFNLVPIGPLDGGRMLQLVLHKFLGEEKGNKTWYYIGVFFLVIIFINIVFGFIKV